MWDVELFFGNGPFNYSVFTMSRVTALRDIGSIVKGKQYWIIISKDGIKLFNDKKEFFCYLNIDYVTPILIENKNKLN